MIAPPAGLLGLGCLRAATVYPIVPPPSSAFYIQSYPPTEVAAAPASSETYGILGEALGAPGVGDGGPLGPVKRLERPEALTKKRKKR